MWDTVWLYGQCDRDIPPLDKERLSVDPSSGLRTRRGNRLNLRVQIRDDGFIKVKGSLPRFLRGDNGTTMRWPDAQEGAIELINTFGLDPGTTRLHRLDIAASMQVKHAPRRYIKLLQHVSRAKRRPYENGVYFHTSQRKLLFYDKRRLARASKRKGAQSNVNLLRYEMQLAGKGLASEMGQPVYLSDLLSPAFFARGVERWYHRYHTVHKEISPVLEPVRKTKELLRQLARIGLETHGGMAALMEEVEDWKILPGELYQHRKGIIKLGEEGGCRTDQALAEELDEMVERSRQEILASCPAR